MSKTEKNYITIKEILKHSKARHLRYIFLKNQWDKQMNYSENCFPEAVAKDRQFTEFFRSVKILDKEVKIKSTVQSWNETDRALSDKLAQAQKQVHDALCDSFDTDTALNALSELVTVTNAYMGKSTSDTEETRKVPLVRTVSRYIFKMLRVFGVYAEDDWPSLTSNDGAVNVEESMTPIVDALAEYRDQVKKVAKDGPAEVFKASDRLRDEVLPHLGIKLEDRGNQAARWTFVDKETLLAEIEEKAQEKLRKEEEKRVKAEKKRLEAELKERKKQTPPQEFFKTFMAEEYS